MARWEAQVEQQVRDFSARNPCEGSTGAFAVLLLVGNLLDGLFTLVLLQLNLARELNPVMDWVYQISPVSFMVAKLALVQFGMLMLWVNRGVRAAQLGLRLGAAMYAGIVLYHVAFVARLTA
jgi:hypothetical protein